MIVRTDLAAHPAGGGGRGQPVDLTVALTGASGAVYAWDLLQRLQAAPDAARVWLIVSDAARTVAQAELGLDPSRPDVLADAGLAKVHPLDCHDMAAVVASGSAAPAAMAIVPCSMATLGALASGAGHHLVHRAADVMLKERRPLVLVPRETPLSVIHLGGMLRLARAGATILPAMPAFYGDPREVADLVGTVTVRVMEHLGLPVDSPYRWRGRS